DRSGCVTDPGGVARVSAASPVKERAPVAAPASAARASTRTGNPAPSAVWAAAVFMAAPYPAEVRLNTVRADGHLPPRLPPKKIAAYARQSSHCGAQPALVGHSPENPQAT